MTIALERYDNPLRETYELYAALAWSGAFVVSALVLAFTNLPFAAFATMGLASGVMAAIRWRQTLSRWDMKINFLGKPFAFMRVMALVKLMKARPNDLWIGFGFEWGPTHTHRALELRKRDSDAVTAKLPPAWYMRTQNAPRKLEIPVGKPWIHGIGGKEQQLFTPLKSVEGHNLIVGTTGAGKTRMFEVLITQAVLRNEPVIAIDPKGDQDFEAVLKNACIAAGRPDAFLKFHPGFPSQSVRLDPLANWNNVTEVASRISSLMQSSGDESFKQMAWKAVHVVAEGLVYTDTRPNLRKLRRFIESGPDRLMEQVFVAFFQRNVPRWEALLAPLIQRIREAKNSRMSGSAELNAYASYYKNEVPESKRCQEVDGLLAMVEHNREHLGKILANLVPLLVQLTSGELGKMLSPDPQDMEDARAIMNTRKVLDGNYVLYIGLDSLSNGSVGSALGAVFLSDLAAVAGDAYNYGDDHAKRRKQVFVDEVAECINDPLIMLLNKARGAGFVMTLATQTIEDVTAKFGDEAKTRQFLGNCNNLYALRTKDASTQEFVTETIGTTYTQSISRTIGVGSETENTGIDYRTTSSMQMREEEVDMFPQVLLGHLQDLHFIASIAGGRLVKGRLPKLLM